MHSMTYAVKYIPKDAKRKQLFTYRFPRYSQRATALIHPTLAIFGKLQGKFFLMTTMGNVPDMSWQVIALCSRHCPLTTITIDIALNFILPLKTYL
jgi:hypothetical protein